MSHCFYLFSRSDKICSLLRLWITQSYSRTVSARKLRHYVGGCNKLLFLWGYFLRTVCWQDFVCLHRSGKGEALTDELQNADRKVEHLRNALQLVSKRLSTGAGNTQGQDPSAREKRLKKLPEYVLGLSMLEASNFDDDDSILKYILYECGKFN